MRKRIVPILIIVMIFSMAIFAMTSCGESESMITKMVVTSSPKVDYYQGETFDTSNGVLTVYFDNGDVKKINITDTMVSNFNSNKIGEQLIAINFMGNVVYLEVNVIDAPVDKIELIDGYKTNYVAGERLNLAEMKILVKYINGYTDTIQVTEDMISGFDNSVIGVQQLVIEYNGKYSYFDISVVDKELVKMTINPPKKTLYIKNQDLDFTGASVRLSYNDNSAKVVDLYSLISSGVITYTFEGQNSDYPSKLETVGKISINFDYDGMKATMSAIIVDEIAVKTLEVVTAPADQAVGGEIDMSAGVIKATYNNGDEQTLSFSDERISVDYSGFDINVVNVEGYDIVITMTENGRKANLKYKLKVVDAYFDELIIVRNESEVYYQYIPNITEEYPLAIDFSTWKYKIKKSNGQFVSENGETEFELTANMLDLVESSSLSTLESGSKKLVFVYEKSGLVKSLVKEVNIEVIPSEITGVVDMVNPSVLTYYVGGQLLVNNGSFCLVYNNDLSRKSNPIEMTYDNVINASEITQVVGQDLKVLYSYENSYGTTPADMGYFINVISKFEDIEVLAQPTKKDYVQGEEFSSEGLLVKIKYENQSNYTEIEDFNEIEWSFDNTTFNEVGSQAVRLYYGDKIYNNYVTIDCNVTNDIVGISLDSEFGGFGEIIEGKSIDIATLENPYIWLNYQNNDFYENDVRKILLTTDLLSYLKVFGDHKVTITYADCVIDTELVNVIKKTLTKTEVIKAPDRVLYESTERVDLTGLELKFYYDNGVSIKLGDFVADGVDRYTLNNNNEKYLLEINHPQSINTEESTFVDIDLTITDIRDNEIIGEETLTIEITWLSALVDTISFSIAGSSDNSFEVFGGKEELLFPENSKLTVVYTDGGEEIFNLVGLNQLESSKYQISGYNPAKPGEQIVKLTYLMAECTFNVNVLPREKAVEFLTNSKDEIVVIEGMSLNPVDFDLKLNFINTDEKYSYEQLELANLTTNYDPTSAIVFKDSQKEGDVRYVNKDLTLEYSYNGTTESLTINLKIKEKSIVSISSHKSPTKKWYYEYESYNENLLIDGVEILVNYNNGTSKLVTMNDNDPYIRVDTSKFDTNRELHYGNSIGLEVIIKYLSFSTIFQVEVRDRGYIGLEYSDKKPYDQYMFYYGTDEGYRPDFTMGLLDENDNIVSVLATGNTIDSLIGMAESPYSIIYTKISDGTSSNLWPKDCGTYKMEIGYYSPNFGTYNNFVKECTIVILPKNIAVLSDDKSYYFGDIVEEFSSEFKEYSNFNGSVSYGDDALEYAQEQTDVISLGYDIFDRQNNLVTFANANGKDIANLRVGVYTITPKIISEGVEFNNYKIKEFVSATLTIERKEIVIEATQDNNYNKKNYGDADPIFKYVVMDAENNVISYSVPGVNQIHNYINMNGYIDDISSYVLLRENGENVGTYDVQVGNPDIISNYNIINFISTTFEIEQRKISITGENASAKFGEVMPKLSFIVDEETPLVFDDTLESVFGDYLIYGTDLYINTILFGSNSFISMINPLTNAIIADCNTYNVTFNSDIIVDGNYYLDYTYFVLLIERQEITVTIYEQTKTYGDIDPELSYGTSYFYTYGSGENYVGETIGLLFEREEGENVGVYSYEITNIADFPNYKINELVVAAVDGVFNNNLIIMPERIAFDYDNSGSYDKVNLDGTKVVENREICAIGIVFKDLADNVITPIDALTSRISYNFSKKGSVVSNMSVGDYDGVFSYKYIIPNHLTPAVEIQNYIPYSEDIDYYEEWDTSFRNMLLGTAREYDFIEEFDYEVTEKAIKVSVNNNETSFQNESLQIIYNDYNAFVCEGDEVTPNISIKARYYERTYDEIPSSLVDFDNITAKMAENAIDVFNAGEYFIKVNSLTNANYKLADYDDKNYSSFLVKPTVLDIALNNVSKVDGSGSNLYRLPEKVYSGLDESLFDHTWNTVKGDFNTGYFYTGSYKILNDVLTKAPVELRVFPGDVNEQNEIVQPIEVKMDDNHNVLGYDIIVQIADEYSNYSVNFVDASGLDAEYEYIINPKIINIINLNKCNTKVYDTLEPVIDNKDELIIGNGPYDNIQIEDIDFIFTRYLDNLPIELQDSSLFESSDVGEFVVKAVYNKSNNYAFEFKKTDRYYITRDNVNIKLNDNSEYLFEKVFDNTLPEIDYDELPINVSNKVSAEDFDVKFVSFRHSVDDVWNTVTGSEKNAGEYSYIFRTKFNKNGVEFVYLDNDYKDNGKNILNWNYTYTTTLYANKPTGVDGVYKIQQKDVYLNVDEDYSSLFDFINNKDSGFVYKKVFSGEVINLIDAKNIFNSYNVVEYNAGSFAPITLDTFIYTDYQNMSSVENIRNAREKFVFDASDIVNNNPDYNIINKTGYYEIQKLIVKLSATAKYNDNNYMDFGTLNPNLVTNIQFAEFEEFQNDLTNSGIDFTNISNFNEYVDATSGTEDFITKPSSSNDYRFFSDGEYINPFVQNTYIDAKKYLVVVDKEELRANNFEFEYVENEDTLFIVNKMNLSVIKATRDYLDKEVVLSSDYPASAQRDVINSIINELSNKNNYVSSKAIDGDAGSGDDYYLSYTKDFLDSLSEQYFYRNYNIDLADINGDLGYDDSSVYLSLVIEKRDLEVDFANKDGGLIEINYNHILNSGEYSFIYNGIPTDINANEFSYNAEVSELNDFLSNEYIDITSLFSYIASLNANDVETEISFSEYINDDIINNNYNITLNNFFVLINKILIELRYVNNAGTKYHSEGYFSMLAGELVSSLKLKTDSSERLNYSLRVANPTDIVGYESSIHNTFAKQLLLMGVLSSEEIIENEFSPNNVIYSDRDSDVVSNEVGLRYLGMSSIYIKNEVNYEVICKRTEIQIYPKAYSVGQSIDLGSKVINVLDYAGASSVDEDMEMFVNVCFNNNTDDKIIENINTGKFTADMDNTYSGMLYSGYSRAWEIIINPEDIDKVAIVGSMVRIKVKFTENFYSNNESSNGNEKYSIETEEFWVRVYGESNTELANTVSYEESSEKYTLSDENALYDVVSTNVILEPTLSDYNFKIQLVDNATNKLTLVFNGNTKVDAKQFELVFFDKTTGVEKVVEYSTDIEGLDIFDGYNHKIVTYIDKVGTNPMLYDDMKSYTVTVVIDDCYNLKFDLEIDGYKDNNEVFLDFDSNYVELLWTGVDAIISRVKIMSLGIDAPIIDGTKYIGGMMLMPSVSTEVENENYYNYQLYLATKNNQNTIFVNLDEFVNKQTINSIYGYDEIGGYRYIYYLDGVPINSIVELETNAIYNIVAKLIYKDNTVLEIQPLVLRISISSTYKKMILIPSSGEVGDEHIASMTKPVIIDASEKNRTSYFTTDDNMAYINYNRLTFDYYPAELNAENALLYYYLKTTDKNIDILNSPYFADDYMGLAFGYNQAIDADNSYVYIKIGSNQVVKIKVDGFVPSEGRNVIEARYDENNNAIRFIFASQNDYRDLVLREIDSLLFSSKAMYTGITIGKAELRILRNEIGLKHIKDLQGLNYGVGLGDSVNIYEEELNESSKIIFSGGDGLPYASSGKMYSMEFSAVESDSGLNAGDVAIKFVVLSNTKEIESDNSLDASTGIGHRGVYLYYKHNGVFEGNELYSLNLGIYKYESEYEGAELYKVAQGTDFDLLNGDTFTIKIELTDTLIIKKIGPQEREISCYSMNVKIENSNGDVKTLASYYPVNNNLYNWVNTTVGAEQDLEFGAGVDQAQLDEYFKSSTSYTGLVLNNVNINIKNLIVY